MLKAPGIILTPPDNLKTNYLLPYFEALPHTQLMIVWGSSMYDKVYDWAVAQGAGMRRDGILSVWSKDGSECFRAHGHAPRRVRILRRLCRDEEERMVATGDADEHLLQRRETHLHSVEPEDLRGEHRVSWCMN